MSRVCACGRLTVRPVSPESGGPFIDQVYVLQGYAEGWKEGAWEEKVDSRPCIEPPLYSQDKHEYYRYRGGTARAPSLGARLLSDHQAETRSPPRTCLNVVVGVSRLGPAADLPRKCRHLPWLPPSEGPAPLGSATRAVRAAPRTQLSKGRLLSGRGRGA